jgi:hypothetical protein
MTPIVRSSWSFYLRRLTAQCHNQKSRGHPRLIFLKRRFYLNNNVEIKPAFRDGTTHVILEPEDFAAVDHREMFSGPFGQIESRVVECLTGASLNPAVAAIAGICAVLF